jgi:hypothetical protein
VTPELALTEHVSWILIHQRSRPLVADIVAKVENRATQKISRKSISGPHCCCLACKRHYEGPSSILAKAIWSLTLPRVRRISGSKNFRSSPQKDFFNNIGRFCSLIPGLGVKLSDDHPYRAHCSLRGRGEPSA